MEDLLYKLNPWWEEEYAAPGLAREKYLSTLAASAQKQEITIVTGLRRVGKTTLLKQTIASLMKNKVPSTRILFAPLDSFGLMNSSIHEILNEFRKIHKIPANEKAYLFLDEVSSREDFQHEAKDLYDNEKVKIFLSGSSASMLRDKKAYLTGRTRTIEIMPLDFQEFLRFRDAEIRKSEPYLLEKYFEEYMEFGGMPEYVLTKDPAYITELVEHLIYKDIIAHHGIKDEKVVKELFRLLCERVGKPTSFNKLSKVLGISVDSVKRYLGYFEDAYLFYSVERCSRSMNERVLSPKKIYAGDVAFRNTVAGFRDLGAIYENLVFLKIKDSKPCYVYEAGVELDFSFADTVIEAKYKREIEEKQQKLFTSLKAKNKIVASGHAFFI